MKRLNTDLPITVFTLSINSSVSKPLLKQSFLPRNTVLSISWPLLFAYSLASHQLRVSHFQRIPHLRSPV